MQASEVVDLTTTDPRDAVPVVKSSCQARRGNPRVGDARLPDKIDSAAGFSVRARGSNSPWIGRVLCSECFDRGPLLSKASQGGAMQVLEHSLQSHSSSEFQRDGAVCPDCYGASRRDNDAFEGGKT